ncbi:MAG TPA: AMP-binding protein [Actinomycetota bacterium]|nr:AMP-binding protein [Actinomycetota bacterium]
MDTGGRDLVALRLRPTPEAPAQLESLWDEGCAVLPVRWDLPEPEVARLLKVARPAAFVDGDRTLRLEDPLPARGALCVPTAGSTGEPRLVELSREALETSARLTARRLDAEGARWLCCLPLDHVAGLMTIVRSRLYGADPVLLPGWDPAFAGGVDADAVSLVPTMLRGLVEQRRDLGRWRWILVGGAGVDPELIARARDLGANVVRTYGMTETCGGVVYDGVPLDGVEVATDETGVVRLRTPTIMEGYRGGAAFGGGWFVTGDLGEWDGVRLKVHGRADDVIVTGGENVAPEEVEALLASHPAVADVAVAGRADPKWGQRVVAYVVPAEGASPALADLRAHVKARAAAHKAPHELVLLDSLPRLPSGKVARASLSSGA